MRAIADWGTRNRKLLLHLMPDVLDTFAKYIQTSGDSLESGGILLGCVRGTNLEIVEATEPSWMDKRFRSFFERQANWHKYVAARRWTASGGTINYLGEWHTHPEDHPRPSSIDLIEWNKLAVRRTDNRPVLAIIVGRLGLHVELANVDGERTVLEPIT